MNTFTIFLGYLCLATATSVTPRQDANASPDAETGISNSGIGAGFLSSAQGREEEDEQQALFATAGMNPNRSSSVTFKYGNPAGLQDDTTWTWRVNITNVNLSPLNSTSTQDQFAANAQFDLQWPGGGSLEDYLAGQGSSAGGQESTLCASRWSYRYPANVTSRYSGTDNGNCSTVLGSQCAASLLGALRAGGPCASTFNASYADDLAGCEDTFNVVKRGPGATQDLGNSTQSLVNYKNESLVSSDPIYFVTYQPLPLSNLSNFDAAQTYLNMLYLSGGGSGNFEPALLCQVVTPPATSAATAQWPSSRSLVALTAGIVLVVALWL